MSEPKNPKEREWYNHWLVLKMPPHEISVSWPRFRDFLYAGESVYETEKKGGD
jgi:hypothetical protein